METKTTKTTVKKFVHNQHVKFVASNAEHIAWVRKRKVTLDRDVYDTEKDGFEDGIIDLLVSLCSIEGPGFPAMLGVGARAVDVPGSLKLSIDVWYYSAFEVGPRLAHKSLFAQKFSDDETIVTPPAWLGLPHDAEEVHDEEQMGEDTVGPEESRGA